MPITEERFKKIASIGVGAAICIAVAPVIFLTIKGLVGLVVAFAICCVLAALMPAFVQLCANLKFRAFKEVVARAPIESLISEQQAAQKDLEEAREQLSAQMAQVESMRDKVREFERTRSDDPDAIARWNERLQEWEKVLAYNVDLFKRAKADVVAFAKIVEQAEMEWSMATADAKIAASFGRKSGDFLRTLRERTALDAVQKASAESRARLRLSVVDHDHVLDQTRDKPAVHAINYTATGKVDLGRVLDLAEINLPSPPPNSAIQ